MTPLPLKGLLAFLRTRLAKLWARRGRMAPREGHAPTAPYAPKGYLLKVRYTDYYYRISANPDKQRLSERFFPTTLTPFPHNFNLWGLFLSPQL